MLAVLATMSNQVLAIGISALAGMSWIAVLSSLHVSVQTALPDWVRARGLSFFLTVFFGSMALGSLVWGQVASLAGLSASLVTAAVGAVVMIAVTWGAKLGQGEDLDLAPSMRWPAPILTNNASPDRGLVMIQVTYTISPQDRETFATVMGELTPARRRGGAYGWTLMQKADASDVFVETWFEASWLRHLRHHEHVAGEYRKLQEQIAALQRARYKTEPLVAHYIDAFASEAADPASSALRNCVGSGQ